MPVHNGDIAEMLNELADILDIQGANSFRVRSYRDAAPTAGLSTSPHGDAHSPATRRDRIFLISSGSRMTAMTFISDPQTGQTNGSIS